MPGLLWQLTPGLQANTGLQANKSEKKKERNGFGCHFILLTILGLNDHMARLKLALIASRLALLVSLTFGCQIRCSTSSLLGMACNAMIPSLQFVPDILVS